MVMAFRWDNASNQFGVPGMMDADWQRAAGKGTHATLSRFDMHNTLIAAGPDFKHGLTTDLPSGNVDIAPTILGVLGIKSGQMDGRVLVEAMTGKTAAPETNTIEATSHLPSGVWKQHLQTSRVDNTIYLDEGNGAFLPSRTTH
jgi:arylsulfatase A-like enzyme